MLLRAEIAVRNVESADYERACEELISAVFKMPGGKFPCAGAVAAATLQEEAAVEGFTIKGLARPPKPPKKPPYEVGSYRWFKWVEERHMLEGAIEGAAEYRRRTGRGGGKLRH